MWIGKVGLIFGDFNGVEECIESIFSSWLYDFFVVDIIVNVGVRVIKREWDVFNGVGGFLSVCIVVVICGINFIVFVL